MAITFGGALGSATNKTTGTTVTLLTGAVVPVGALVVVIWAADSLTATTPFLSSVTDTRSNVYTCLLLPITNPSSTAGAHQSAAIAVSKITTALGSGDVINAISSSASTVVKAVDAAYFLGASTATRASLVAAIGGSAPTVTYPSGLAGDLVIGIVANQNSVLPTGDTDTVNGSWVVLGGVASTGGTASTNISVYSQYKILTASGSQIYNPTISGSPSSGVGIVAFKPALQGTGTDSGLGSETATGNIPSVGINHSYWGTDALL